jgi:hypothetical protein
VPTQPLAAEATSFIENGTSVMQRSDAMVKNEYRMSKGGILSIFIDKKDRA